MSHNLPSFTSAWLYFSEINVPVSDVGRIIGGNVKINIDSGAFQNACAIRFSYVLNKRGLKIKKSAKYASVSGADKNQYLYRVNDMISYLRDQFGKPTKEVPQPKPDDFSKQKGILVFVGSGWSNASGHITLWNSVKCSDSCYFLNSPSNGTFQPSKGLLWELK